MELGCGLGHFTSRIATAAFTVLGVDVSPTAIEKARLQYSSTCEFCVRDILDYDIYRKFRPELLVMSEITWYILDKLDAFLDFARTELYNVYLLPLLVTYPPGVQKYGTKPVLVM